LTLAISFGWGEPPKWFLPHTAEGNERLLRRHSLPSAPACTGTEAAELARGDS